MRISSLRRGFLLLVITCPWLFFNYSEAHTNKKDYRFIHLDFDLYFDGKGTLLKIYEYPSEKNYVITFPYKKISMPKISPDGSHLLVADTYEPSKTRRLVYYNLVLLDLKKRKVVNVIPSTYHLNKYAWISTDKFIFIEGKRNNWKAYVIDIKGQSQEIQIPKFYNVHRILSDNGYVALWAAESVVKGNQVWVGNSEDFRFTRVSLEKFIDLEIANVENMDPIYLPGLKMGAILQVRAKLTTGQIRTFLITADLAEGKKYDVVRDITELNLWERPWGGFTPDAKFWIVSNHGCRRYEVGIYDPDNKTILECREFGRPFSALWQKVSSDFQPEDLLSKRKWDFSPLFELHKKQQKGR